MVRSALSIAGYGVEESADGPGALHRIQYDPPDLVVLDLGLPTVSGIIVRQEIAAHAHTRHIPIVIVTGSSQSLDDLDACASLSTPRDSFPPSASVCGRAPRPSEASGSPHFIACFIVGGASPCRTSRAAPFCGT